MANLSAAFLTGVYKNWAVYGLLFAHAKAAAEQLLEGVHCLVEWATLLYCAAWYTEQRSNAAEAEQLAVALMKMRQKMLGREHKNT